MEAESGISNKLTGSFHDLSLAEKVYKYSKVLHEKVLTVSIPKKVKINLWLFDQL